MPSLPRISLMQIRVGDTLVDPVNGKQFAVAYKKTVGRVMFKAKGSKLYLSGAYLFAQGFTQVERAGVLIGELKVK